MGRILKAFLARSERLNQLASRLTTRHRNARAKLAVKSWALAAPAMQSTSPKMTRACSAIPPS